MSAPYSCPAPCDPDCEINGWGCHDAHLTPSRRVHGVEECKAMTLAANLRSLVESGWLAQFGESRGPDGSPAGCYASLRRMGGLWSVNFTGRGVAEATGKARAWAAQAKVGAL